MFQGTLCPACKKPVMTYRRFFREAEPFKISKCSHCQVELKRSPAVWLLLLLGCAVAAVAARFILNLLPSGVGFVGNMVAFMLLMAILVLILNFCGWLFVGWKVARK